MSDTEIEPISEIQFLKNLKNNKDCNILLYSEDFNNNVWTPSNGIKSIFQTAILNPTNTTTVSSVSGSPSIYQDIFLNSKNSIGQFTFSIYAHNSSLATGIELSINFVDAYTKSASIVFNPQNGKIINQINTNNIPLDNFYSENAGNGWYRYSITISQLSAIDTVARAEIFYNSTTPLAAPWNNNITIWSAQFQKNSTSKNYIKTIKTEKQNIVDQGFNDLSLTEPSLGLPYVQNLLTNSQTYSSWQHATVSHCCVCTCRCHW
jgi:hypothetical protein